MRPLALALALALGGCAARLEVVRYGPRVEMVVGGGKVARTKTTETVQVRGVEALHEIAQSPELQEMIRMVTAAAIEAALKLLVPYLPTPKVELPLPMKPRGPVGPEE